MEHVAADQLLFSYLPQPKRPAHHRPNYCWQTLCQRASPCRLPIKPPASFEEQQEIRREEEARRQNQPARVPGNQTGNNASGITPGPVGIAAHQAEVVDAEGAYGRVLNDEWNFCDEDTEFRGAYACESCYEDENEWDAEEEAHAAAKRTSVEMEESDDERPRTSWGSTMVASLRAPGWSFLSLVATAAMNRRAAESR